MKRKEREIERQRKRDNYFRLQGRDRQRSRLILKKRHTNRWRNWLRRK